MDGSNVFSVWKDPEITEGPTTFNWSIFTIAVLWGGVVLAASIFVVVKQPYLRASDVAYDPRLVGRRGWLALLGFALIVGTLRLGATVVEAAPAYSNEAWAAVSTPGGAYYDPMAAPLLLFELVANLAQVALSLIVVHAYLAKKRSFALLFIVRQVASVAFMAIDLGLAAMLIDGDTSGTSSLIAAAIGSALWIRYVLRSPRVRSTFLPPPRIDDLDPAAGAREASVGQFGNPRGSDA